ncbi:ABC transporter ATP-binding protein [Shouchella shacheensis]|uniref:ABC transporter ATP-binding protein n=1 Tax=Shouchella shacheensis TaxID=1649580 RepID=UPI00073FD64A|nr:ABC transporter ATP-binding protein [Shouchella shacheensis]
MIEMTDVTKRFKGVEAVKGMNFYLEKGEAVGLLGPNGAGKSTAISMLSSLVKPTTGEVRFKGEPINKQMQTFRRSIGVVPQEIALLPQLTAEENLLFFGQIYKLSGRALKKKAERLLALVGLTERRKDKVKTFSGGMKRRLNTAAALMHDPEFLLMDEPTVGVDPQSRRHLLDTVKDLQKSQGVTVLYTSHYMEEVEYLCDRLYVMDRGDVIASGSKGEIKGVLSQARTYELRLSEKREEIEQALQEDGRVEAVAEIDNGYRVTSTEPDFFMALLEIVTAAGADVRGIEANSPTLEDVFLHLTGRTLRD